MSVDAHGIHASDDAPIEGSNLPAVQDIDMIDDAGGFEDLDRLGSHLTIGANLHPLGFLGSTDGEGADDILRVPMEVAVESASLHPVLCWMYGRGVSLPKVRRLLLGASDHLLLRGACALAQKWGLKGFVQALEDAAFGVGGVQACEALGTTRPLLRAAVENWLPSGDTVRALGLSRRCREWAGPGASSCR